MFEEIYAAEIAASEWWNRLTRAEKQTYLKAHPRSKMRLGGGKTAAAKTSAEPAKPASKGRSFTSFKETMKALKAKHYRLARYHEDHNNVARASKHAMVSKHAGMALKHHSKGNLAAAESAADRAMTQASRLEKRGLKSLMSILQLRFLRPVSSKAAPKAASEKTSSDDKIPKKLSKATNKLKPEDRQAVLDWFKQNNK